MTRFIAQVLRATSLRILPALIHLLGQVGFAMTLHRRETPYLHSGSLIAQSEHLPDLDFSGFFIL
jgi:hypothetical protein